MGAKPGSPEEPIQYLERTCGAKAPGASVHVLTGSVWMKAKSPEASGQFPATVKVTGSDRLEMEVTNLLGGPEATIKVNGASFEIRASGKGRGGKDRVQTGTDTWAGIPLRWAPDLFLGRVPCPEDSVRASAQIRMNEGGELVIETPGERYTYGYRSWAGAPWPEKLTWRRTSGAATEVAFEFDQPDDKTGSPAKWEARSSRGEVKVRWKDRDVKR
jgi:hypothetical protein